MTFYFFITNILLWPLLKKSHGTKVRLAYIFCALDGHAETTTSRNGLTHPGKQGNTPHHQSGRATRADAKRPKIFGGSSLKKNVRTCHHFFYLLRYHCGLEGRPSINIVYRVLPSSGRTLVSKAVRVA